MPALLPHNLISKTVSDPAHLFPEGEGLCSSTLKTCDFRVRMPMQGRVWSLNVSVAAAVVSYEALRQRTATSSG
jgi:23S rRNA (guanosine2251-2'-O)-methyltransferase